MNQPMRGNFPNPNQQQFSQQSVQQQGAPALQQNYGQGSRKLTVESLFGGDPFGSNQPVQQQQPGQGPNMNGPSIPAANQGGQMPNIGLADMGFQGGNDDTAMLQQLWNPAQPGQNQGGQQNPLDMFVPKPQNAGQNPQGTPQGQQQPQQPGWEDPFIAANMDQFGQAVGKLDFVGQQLTPEVMQQIQQGNVQAFQGVLNSVARQAFQQAVTMSHRMNEGGLRSYHERVQPKWKETMTEFQASNVLASKSSNYQHPALQKIAKDVLDRAKQANPHATPDQLAEMVDGHMQGIAAAFAGQSQNSQGPTNPLTGAPLNGQGSPNGGQGAGDDFSRFFS